MKGWLYACDWLEQNQNECDEPNCAQCEEVMVSARTRALWVPEAGLLFQWPLPRGKIQVIETKKFPPPPTEARATFLEDRNVPYPVIREARKYIDRAKHIHTKEAVIQKAMDRITDEAVRSEGRLQGVLTKAGLQS